MPISLGFGNGDAHITNGLEGEQKHVGQQQATCLRRSQGCCVWRRHKWHITVFSCPLIVEVSCFFWNYNSDFVTDSYGESWDSSCETSRVPVQNQWVPVKKKRVRNWKCLGLYVTRQLMWSQTPKPCITVYWNLNTVLLFSSTTKAKRNMHR